MGQWLSLRPIALAALTGSVLAWALASTACVDGGGGAPGTGGAGGEGGAPGCPDEVAPLFTLRVSSVDGRLPDDLQLQVSWSAGDEPLVTVADAATYGTTEDNVVCVRNPGGAPGAGASSSATGGGGGDVGGAGGVDEPSSTGSGGAGPVDELLCELWTSGPTRVRLDATGYVPFDETLPPATVDGCDRPVPSEVVIEVVAEEPPPEG